MAKKFAVVGPGGPVVVGDHLRRDRPAKSMLAGQIYCTFSVGHQSITSYLQKQPTNF